MTHFPFLHPSQISISHFSLLPSFLFSFKVRVWNTKEKLYKKPNFKTHLRFRNPHNENANTPTARDEGQPRPRLAIGIYIESQLRDYIHGWSLYESITCARVCVGVSVALSTPEK